MDAIEYETDLSDADRWHLADNAAFFQTVLPGRDAPLGAPGGPQEIGRIGVDTPSITVMAAKRQLEH